MSYATHFLREGRTNDIECSRSSARLSLAHRILEAERLDPQDREGCSDKAIDAAYDCADTLIRERTRPIHRAIAAEKMAR